MSTYINFEEKMVHLFDKAIQPVGSDVLVGLLHVYCDKSFKDLHVLDAGCGTGKYARHLIDMGIKKITLLDASAEMLTIAKKKLSDAVEEKIIDDIVEAKLPDLPFADGTFDVIMFNFVLNHIETIDDVEQFAIIETTLHNAKRCLRPSGVMIITTMLPSVYKEAFWYSRLHKEITEKYCKYFPSVEKYLELFSNTGFQCVSALNYLHATDSTGIVNYYDSEGPLREDWRQGTFAFAHASQSQIEEMRSFVLELKEKCLLEDFMNTHDHTSEFGSETLLFCIAN